MSENANTALVRRWFEEVWNQGKLDTIDELLAPEVIVHDLLGPGGTIQGPAAFRQTAELLHTAFGEMHFTVEDIFGVEDRVSVRLQGKLKHTGPLGDLPATGAEICVPAMCIIHVRDGKFTAGWNSWDVGAALRAAAAPAGRACLF